MDADSAGEEEYIFFGKHRSRRGLREENGDEKETREGMEEESFVE